MMNTAKTTATTRLVVFTVTGHLDTLRSLGTAATSSGVSMTATISHIATTWWIDAINVDTQTRMSTAVHLWHRADRLTWATVINPTHAPTTIVTILAITVAISILNTKDTLLTISISMEDGSTTRGPAARPRTLEVETLTGNNPQGDQKATKRL